MNKPTPTPAANPEQPEPQYRALMPGEYLQEGDEALDHTGWFPSSRAGQTVGYKDYHYRRPITPPTPAVIAPSAEKHIPDCQIGDNWMNCGPCVEQFNGTSESPIPAPSAETASETPEEWLRDGRMVYVLRETGEYRNGEPVLTNLWTASVQPGRGCSDKHAEAIAERIQNVPRLERELTQAQADLRAAQQERDEAKLDLSAKTAWLDGLLLLKKEADRIVAHVCGGLQKPGNTEDKLREAFDCLIRSNQQNMEALETNIPAMKEVFKANQEFTDTLDLMRDEFQRVKVCPGVTDEIKGLCERAISGIHQRVPVIVQRDNAQQQLAATQQALDAAREAINQYLEVGYISKSKARAAIAGEKGAGL